MRPILKYLCALVVAPACATIGSSGAGDRDLPTTGVGPFRSLADQETLDSAPFVLDSRVLLYRDPAILPLDPQSGDTRVALYAVAKDGNGAGAKDIIVRTRADDARSFYGTSPDTGHVPPKVLAADAAWEGGQIGGPGPVWIGGQIFLYYAGKGGIGLARSTDGLTFTKEPAPVLVRDATVAWETAAPSAPSVAVYPDGKIRMLYAAGSSIGEAESDDGLVWRRLGSAPVLIPSQPVDPKALLPGQKPPFDTARVTDPWLAPRITPAGRLQVRVLYTGFDATGQSAIGFAARYGDTGPLTANPGPVYAVGKMEQGPSLFEWPTGSMLYIQQARAGDVGMTYPSIAAAFAPANITLAAAMSFADGP